MLRFQLSVMADKCDICGFEVSSYDRYCGQCNVDLREPKQPGEQKPNPEKIWSFDKRDKPASKKEKPDEKKVIPWCTIRTLGKSSDLSFPYFFSLVILLARGEWRLGFCNCTSCNLGYRELQAWIMNEPEKKKLTAQSREVVIKASYDKIETISYDIPKFLERYKAESFDEKSGEKDDSPIKKVPSGKITIEIDCEVLDNAVLNVLKSEKGREVIQSIPRKYRKVKSKD